MNRLPPIVCVVGKKKSGKTTTLTGLSSELSGRGYRVMTVKHGHHFRLDHEGTDSWRHVHEGGADRVVLAGPDGFAVTGGWGPGGQASLEVLVRRHLSEADLVLAEGYKASSATRIEVYRRAAHPDALYGRDEVPASQYLAVLTDVPDFTADVPIVDMDDPARFGRLADLVEAHISNSRDTVGEPHERNPKRGGVS